MNLGILLLKKNSYIVFKLIRFFAKFANDGNIIVQSLKNLRCEEAQFHFLSVYRRSALKILASLEMAESKSGVRESGHCSSKKTC